MIKLSNGRRVKYVVASGALAFDGKGWLWERVLVWLGFIKPELFTVVLKTLTLHRIEGNLNWSNPLTWLPWSPWSCVRFIPGGVVNKVGLTNPGIEYWCENIAPAIDFEKLQIVVSIFGTKEELVRMARRLNVFRDLVAIELNVSCPNHANPNAATRAIVDAAVAVENESIHPIFLKLGVDQEYLDIAQEVKGLVSAIALNSVPFALVFSGQDSPVQNVGKPGKGGVSGKPAQEHNWQAVIELSKDGSIPVIAPSVMEYEDLASVLELGAEAISFGAIHLRKPWKPTQIVQRAGREDRFGVKV